MTTVPRVQRCSWIYGVNYYHDGDITAVDSQVPFHVWLDNNQQLRDKQLCDSMAKSKLAVARNHNDGRTTGVSGEDELKPPTQEYRQRRHRTRSKMDREGPEGQIDKGHSEGIARRGPEEARGKLLWCKAPIAPGPSATCGMQAT